MNLKVYFLYCLYFFSSLFSSAEEKKRKDNNTIVQNCIKYLIDFYIKFQWTFLQTQISINQYLSLFSMLSECYNKRKMSFYWNIGRTLEKLWIDITIQRTMDINKTSSNWFLCHKHFIYRFTLRFRENI